MRVDYRWERRQSRVAITAADPRELRAHLSADANIVALYTSGRPGLVERFLVRVELHRRDRQGPAAAFARAAGPEHRRLRCGSTYIAWRRPLTGYLRRSVFNADQGGLPWRAVRARTDGDETMNKQRVKGLTNQATGAVKKSVGKLTGDSALKARGQARDLKGKAQEKTGKAKDAMDGRDTDLPRDKHR
jgi:uncharacterized protein YjbJ (UPF0337 family)